MNSERLLHEEAKRLRASHAEWKPRLEEKGKSEAAHQHAMQALYAEALRRTLRRLRSGNHRRTFL